MRLNAPRVKFRGVRGRFVRECDYAATMGLAVAVHDQYQSEPGLSEVVVMKMLELKRREVRDYPSVIAVKAKRGEKYAASKTIAA